MQDTIHSYGDNFSLVIPVEYPLHTPDEATDLGDLMEPIRLRTHAQKQTTDDVVDTLDYPGEPTRMPSSAVRYTDRQGNPVIQRGNTQFVFHNEPPPRRRRRPRWLVISGLSMMVLIFLWAGLSWLTSWIASNQLNATYEFPRVFQADAVVYPGDTSDHPSHYLFLNLNGTVAIIEMPHGDATRARVYKGPTLFDHHADQVPVTGEFRVVNGKVEMLVHIQDRIILYIFDGTQFKPQ